MYCDWWFLFYLIFSKSVCITVFMSVSPTGQTFPRIMNSFKEVSHHQPIRPVLKVIKQVNVRRDGGQDRLKNYQRKNVF
jgi:hypothetical protein